MSLDRLLDRPLAPTRHGHRKASAVLVATVLVFLVVAQGAAQQDFSQVQMQTVPIAGNVSMLIGAGGNIGVSAGADGILIVDDQFAPLADKIRAALGAISPGKIDFLLNTHWHWDHTGGNATFGKEATIIAHRNVRTRLSSQQTVRGRVIEPSPPEALPVVTFDDGLSLHWNGEEIQVMHFPAGHTDGDSFIWFRSANVIHLGDEFFAGAFPFVDLASGGNVVGLERNIAKVLTLIPNDTKVIPGHGPLSTVGDLRAYHGMLAETLGLVRKAKEAGRTVDEIVKAGLGEKWKSWGTGFINETVWIQTIYQSLDLPDPSAR